MSADVVRLQGCCEVEDSVVALLNDAVEGVLYVGDGHERQRHEALHVASDCVRLILGVDVEDSQAVVDYL